MLRYSVKLGEKNYKREILVWSEKYVSPDLSFVSGVTNQNYRILNNDVIAASIGDGSNFASLYIQTKDVCRKGYVIVKKKHYKVGKTKKSTTGSVFRYVNINGVFYYLQATSGGKITVKNWLKESWVKKDGKYKVSVIEGDVEAFDAGDYVELDTIFWIEDKDTITIDGNTYIFDKNDKSEFSTSPGGIKYYETGRSLYPEEVTPCTKDTNTGHGVIDFNYFSNVSDYLYVTKFILTKKDEKNLSFERLNYCAYFYYVPYKDNYCPIREKYNDDREITGYVCEVPNRLTGDPQDIGVTEFPVEGLIVDDDNKLVSPKRISKLKDYEPYITIDGIAFYVEHLLKNANAGDEIGLYLTSTNYTLGIGDKVVLSVRYDSDINLPVYEIDNNKFVMYNGARYEVEKDIADVVIIDGAEYDVTYPDGKKKTKDALVTIKGQHIPMQIVENTEGDLVVERYGLIVKTDTEAAKAVYEIKTYDGVKIEGNVYKIHYGVDGDYVMGEFDTNTEFQIIDTVGSSLFVCVPYFEREEYDDDFIDTMSFLLCDFYISNKISVIAYAKNNAFGTREITPNIGFVGNTNATSSNDYYDLFKNLVLYVNTGYIQMDIPFTINTGLNGLQEDIVNGFFRSEREKAINPIIDIEKDVYTPMYITNSDSSIGKYLGKKSSELTEEEKIKYRKAYVGSFTEFFPVTEIVVNPHFRTRNMLNWKVNDPNTDVSVVGKDNWFCTDFYPYKDMLSTSYDELMNSADVLGLLNFGNDDIFFQRDKVGKTFLRFSYYDSPDPNVQSLLCTSTVFYDEHSAFKKYADGSRKNINYYGMVQEVDSTVSPGHTVNRISVTTECLKDTFVKSKTYTKDDVDTDRMVSDKKRLSCRFTIKNKYETETSSEGFYLYIFREYSENLHPKPIYMKVEFNHAGIGRTIPFIIPMKWKYPSESGHNNEKVPDTRLTLSPTSQGSGQRSDLEILEEGYKLSFVYAQTYIPLYAVYDFKHKQYAYVFDSRYVDVGDDGKVKLNMFEIKIMDEDSADKSSRSQVRNNNIERANININTAQFPD